MKLNGITRVSSIYDCFHQRGVSLVETVIMLPILMLVGLGALQFAFIYEAKSSLNYATFMGARAGAFDHANPESIRMGFAKGLAPLYSPDPTEAGLLRAQRQVGEDFQNDLVHLAILNPTQEAFLDFGDDLDQDGASDDLPNLDLHAASTGVGSRSGVNIQDANLLKLHVTYGARLNVPFVGPLFATFARAVTDDPIQIAMLEQGRLPLIASATVRMQNHATRNALVLSRDEVAAALQDVRTPNPNPIEPPGNGTGGNGGGILEPAPGNSGGPGNGGGGIINLRPVVECDPTIQSCVENELPPEEGCEPGLEQFCLGAPIMCNGGATPGPNSNESASGRNTTSAESIFNPIHVVTGNKYQVERDLPALSGTLGLRFDRYYNSHDHQSNILGVGWRHSYSQQLTRQDNNRLRLINNDGRAIVFLPQSEPAVPEPAVPVRQASVPGVQKVSTASTAAVAVRSRQWQARSIADGRIIQDPATGYYHWQQHNGDEASFNQDGQLIGLRAPNGATVNLYYTRQGQLQQVVDPQQRKLSFNYYPNGRLKTLIDPAGQRIRYSYDDKGNLDYTQRLGSVDAPLNPAQQAKRQYHYDDPHDPNNLTGITNANGERYVSWYYDEHDRAIGGYHAHGADHVSLDFSTPGQTLVTNSAGEQSVYHTTVIQGIPLVTAIDGPGCSTCGVADSQYVYDDNAQLIQSRTEGGLTTHYHYDSQGRLTHTEIKDEQGQTHQPQQRVYQGDNLQPSQTVQQSVNPNGEHRTQLTYNRQQQLTQIAEQGFSPHIDGSYSPISRTTTLRYDGPDLIAIDGPRDDVDDSLRLTYDNKHRLRTLTSPDGRVLEIQDYDAYGRPTRIQTGEQSPLMLTYNAQGQPIQIRQGPNSLSYDYSASGQLIGLTGPDGERVEIRYDQADRATHIIQANGPQLSLNYDTESRLTQQSLSNANGDILSTVSLLYDAEGRLRQKRTQQHNNDTLRHYEYDHNDRLTRVSNAQGDQLNVDYNPLGQLLSLSRSHQHQTTNTADNTNNLYTGQLAYDHKGQAISLTDPNGNTTQQLKDDFGRIVALISPDSGTTTYTYDPAGNRIQKTDAAGQTETATYDAANRLIQSQTQDGTTQYSYHPTNGQLIQVTQQTEQGQSQERFDYDKEGRLITHHRDLHLANNETKTLTTEYDYNEKGKLSHKHLPDGQTLRYHYYQDGKHRGQIRAITRESFFGQDVIIGEIDPNPWDGDLGYVFGNGLKARANYKNGRLTNQQDGQLKLVYEYDAAGNIIQIDQNGTLKQYRYDQLGRLTTASVNQQIYRYQYDTLGNRTAKTVSSKTAEITAETEKASAENNVSDKAASESKARLSELQLNTYNQSESNRLQQINDQAITYNPAGSPKTYPTHQGKGVRSYDYNANQRPIRLYIDQQLRAEYEYNAFGERIRKTVYPRKAKGQSKRTNKNNNNSDDDGDGEPPAPITTYYLYDGRQLTAEVNDQGKITQQYLYYHTAPVALLKKKTLYHIHSDHLGTPQQITDSKGRLQWQADYAPFGKATINPDPDRNGKTITLNLRFAGQYEDQESGTYYNYFRDYDPETGRYLTSDPIGIRGGLNTYAYVGNNPLSAIDPLGLMEAGANQPLSDQDLANIPKPSVDPTFRDNFTQIFDAAIRSIESQNTDGSQNSLLDSLSQVRNDIPLLVGVLSILEAIRNVPEVGAQALISIALATVGIGAVGLTNGFLEVVRRIEALTRQQVAAGGCVALPVIEREGARLGQILTQFDETINTGGLFEIAAKLANSFPDIGGVQGGNVSEVARGIEQVLEAPLSEELQRLAPTGVLSGFTQQEQEEIVGRVTPQALNALDAAILAQVTYEAFDLPDDSRFEEIDPESIGLRASEFSNSESGFSATLFRNTLTGEYVLGFRGTDGFVNPDNISNLQQGLGISSEQYRQATRLARDVNRNSAVDGNLSFVGHSLGGGLASAAALATGQDAQTFNAAGLSEGEQARIAEQFGRQTPNVTAYYIQGEVLSTLQDSTPLTPNAFGRRIALEAPSLTLPPAANNPVDRSFALHGIRVVIEALE